MELDRRGGRKREGRRNGGEDVVKDELLWLRSWLWNLQNLFGCLLFGFGESGGWLFDLGILSPELLQTHRKVCLQIEWRGREGKRQHHGIIQVKGNFLRRQALLLVLKGRLRVRANGTLERFALAFAQINVVHGQRKFGRRVVCVIINIQLKIAVSGDAGARGWAAGGCGESFGTRGAGNGFWAEMYRNGRHRWGRVLGNPAAPLRRGGGASKRLERIAVG